MADDGSRTGRLASDPALWGAPDGWTSLHYACAACFAAGLLAWTPALWWPPLTVASLMARSPPFAPEPPAAR